ncbi:MBOAT family O-acyltransferase [Tahibacter amnicola]|uniref:Probable alginate O-acetylase n=1 Tax=Tahibacter amnicola TaxID=2976241 RepID=A0ABY6BCQ0_9GAMM|nr:MBOAT family O-acyltransferase [Tahibacter amnicola]UXI67509.1 MBOAT family protein [Tahibacter amnicola]
MLFNSIHFVVFFLAVFAMNNLLRPWPTAQKLMLLAASYYFYGQWSWMYLGLILWSTLLDYAIGLGMVRVRHPQRLLWVSLATNLGLLAFFKYTNWLIENWNVAAGAVGFTWQFSPMDIILPVGISFYTFQSLSYTIDVYRGVSTPRRNLLDYALFVAFFPQLAAGPIVRDYEFFRELDGDRRLDVERAQQALVLIAFGFAKKIVFADNLAPIVDHAYATPAALGFWDSLLATYAFAFQIYCDFSGYTDIAIGTALLLGFRYPQNFNYPYIATSLQDFWRRWHISLSRWLRDYLYVSLGGNRKGPGRTYINLMLTMLLGGLWHGASWNFVIWGGVHGGYLAFERAVLQRIPLWNSEHVAVRCLRWFVTFHVVCFAWIFFRAKTFADSQAIIANLAFESVLDFDFARHGGLALLLGIMLAAHLLGGGVGTKERVMRDRGPVFAVTLAAIALMLIWFTPAATSAFIYFQF